MTTSELKNHIRFLGADLVGIASVDRFSNAPEGFHPLDVLTTCKSVISFGIEFSKEYALSDDVKIYTHMRDVLTDECDRIAGELCQMLTSNCFECVAVPTCDSNYDTNTNRWRSIISIKHAAEAAGLGTIGRHSLLITPEYGALCCLGCVLTNAEFDYDELCSSVCTNCNLCVEACPVGAIDSIKMNQQKCDEYAYREEGIVCHNCRDACPLNFSIRNI